MELKLTGILILLAVTAISQESLSVHFSFDKYVLTSGAKNRLDSLVAATKNETGLTINIDGHCDNTGPAGYNDVLSQKRANAVREYLLKHGIQAANITQTKWHGENEPLNDNKTALERKLNRRVAITLITPGNVGKSNEEIKTLTQQITDTATKAGTNITLRNMNFYGGTPYLLPESFPIVEELISVMQNNPGLVIQIEGHICCVGGPDDSPYGPAGIGLSEARARAIYAELIGKGIASNRVSYKGYGHSMPLYPFPERNEEERVANRRVEVKIVSK